MMHPLRARWNALPARDRLALSLGGLAIAMLLVWQAGVRPAWLTLRDAPARLANAEQQLNTMRQLAAEAMALQQAGPVTALPREEVLHQLEATTQSLGPSARLQLMGDLVTVTVEGVTATQLAQWLAQVRRTLNLKPQASRLQRDSQGPDSWSGTLTWPLESAQRP